MKSKEKNRELNFELGIFTNLSGIFTILSDCIFTKFSLTRHLFPHYQLNILKLKHFQGMPVCKDLIYVSHIGTSSWTIGMALVDFLLTLDNHLCAKLNSISFSFHFFVAFDKTFWRDLLKEISMMFSFRNWVNGLNRFSAYLSWELFGSVCWCYSRKLFWM